MFLPYPSRLGPALALGLLLALVCLPGLSRADDDDDDKKKNNNESQQSTSKNKKNNKAPDDAPDLEVLDGTLFKNSFGQVNDRLVAFRVANIGTEDAPASTALIEITGSSQAVELKVPVPALKAGGTPFYGTAELPGPCDGHSAEVSVDLKGDASLSNNSVGPNKLCPEKPKAPQGQTPNGPAGTLDQARRQGLEGALAGKDPDPLISTLVLPDFLPEHMKPGTHTLELEPSDIRSVIHQTKEGPCGGLLDEGGYSVGWFQTRAIHLLPCTVALVAQTAVKFNLSQLDEVPKKAVTKATLTFDETARSWTDSEGHDRLVDGCVAVLGIASVDWASQPSVKAFVPNDYFTDVIPHASRDWNVTSPLLEQVRFPQDRALRYGFVLSGALDDVQADDETSCLSFIDNIRLHVTYTVPPE